MIEFLLEESSRLIDPIARESLDQFKKARKLDREEFIGKIEPASVKHALLSSDLFVEGGDLVDLAFIISADLKAVKDNKDFKPDRLAESPKLKKSPSRKPALNKKPRHFKGPFPNNQVPSMKTISTQLNSLQNSLASGENSSQRHNFFFFPQDRPPVKSRKIGNIQLKSEDRIPRNPLTHSITEKVKGKIPSRPTPN